MQEVESSFEELQRRKQELQHELSDLKKNLSRFSNDEGSNAQVKSHLQSEVGHLFIVVF